MGDSENLRSRDNGDMSMKETSLVIILLGIVYFLVALPGIEPSWFGF